LLAIHEGVRPALNRGRPEGTEMDYIIGGIATILLFAYLIVALLKPEKF
jgi:K+-transporting ATPase KdpF subunit